MATITAPQNLRIVQATFNSQALAWTNGTPANGTFVEQKIGAGSWSVVKPLINNPESVVVTGLTPGATYAYRVRTWTNGTYSAYSNEVAGTTPLAVTFLAAPTGLLATIGGNGSSAALVWVDHAISETAYTVERSGDGGLTWSLLSATLAPNTASYQDNGPLAPGTLYTYRVRATKTNLVSAYAACVLTTPSLPVAPTGVVATAGNATVTVTWAGVAGATSYNVYRSAVQGGPYSQVAAGAASPYPDAGLINDTPYFYVVTAVNVVGESGFSTEASAMPATSLVAPNAPTNISAVAGAAGVSAIVMWTDNADNEEAYAVDRSADGGGTWTSLTSALLPNATSYPDNGPLVPGVTYRYRVKATNAAGSSNYAISTVTMPSIPAAPLNLQAAARDANASLTWNASAGATSYNLNRGTVHGGPYVKVASGVVSPFLDAPLVNGTTYYYVVTAVNGVGESPNSLEVSAAPAVAASLPAAPSSVVVQPGANGISAAVSWTDNAIDETAYEIGRSADGGISWVLLSGALGPNTASYQDNGPLVQGGTYQYRVRAKNAVGNSAYATGSAMMLTRPAAPSALGINVISSSQLTLRWTDNSNSETGFAVERSLSAGGPFATVANVGPNVTSFPDAGLQLLTQYFYRVKATGGALGDSAYSAVASATTLGVSSGFPAGYIQPPGSYVYASGARTDHPRLLITNDNLATYRAWAASNNPRWQDLLAVVNGLRADYNSGAMYANDPGLTSGGFARSDGARMFALMSLIDPDPAARPGWATLAHTVLMDLINIMVLGAISTSPQTSFRDPGYSVGDAARSVGEALPMAVDWIYASLSSDDKAKIRQVFLRWTQERLNASVNFIRKGVYYDPILRTAGNALRQAGNNYICCHGRNILAAALCLDPADDVPSRVGGAAGYDTVPANALTAMVNGYIGLWAYQREWFEAHDTAGGFSQEGVEYGTSSSMGACALSQALLASTRHDDEVAYGSYAGWGNHAFWNNDFPLGFCHSFSPVLGTVPGLPYQEYLPLCYGDIQAYSPAEGTQLFAGVCLRARAKGIDATDQMAQWWMQNFTYSGPTRLSAYLRSYQVYGAHLALNGFLTCDPNASVPDPRPSLPLDVYGPGLGRMISRDQWGASGRSVDTVCAWGGTDHIDSSQGGFEYWRKGEWLTKFCNGYGVVQGCSDRKNVMSLENTADPNDHWYSMDDQQHGSQYIYVMRGDPVSVQSFGAGYAYQQMTLTELYNENVAFLAQDILHASRSLFYLKPDLVLLYDRAQHQAVGRYSRLRINAQNAFSLAGSVGTATTPNGQKLFVTSLLPLGAAVTAAGIPSFSTDSPATFEMMANQVVVEDLSKPQVARFLTVVEGADSGGSRTVPALVQQSSGNAYAGAKVGGVLVLFKDDITANFTGLSFTAPGGTTAAYVTGLVPGANYTVTVAGQDVTVSPGGSAVADTGGVLKVI